MCDGLTVDALGELYGVHRATAAEVFGIDTSAVDAEQRRYAKTINFGLIYGMSAYGLARSRASSPLMWAMMRNSIWL